MGERAAAMVDVLRGDDERAREEQERAEEAAGFVKMRTRSAKAQHHEDLRHLRVVQDLSGTLLMCLVRTCIAAWHLLSSCDSCGCCAGGLFCTFLCPLPGISYCFAFPFLLGLLFLALCCLSFPAVSRSLLFPIPWCLSYSAVSRMPQASTKGPSGP